MSRLSSPDCPEYEADLGFVPVATKKPAFPKGALEQTAAIMAALALSASPLSSAELALGFKQGRKVEPRIRAALASLARTGFISVSPGGQTFTLRRAA